MQFNFLKGAGEMGKRMHALDWTATPLGEPSQWPQSLRTSVSVCLHSRFPILVWWGPELVMLYNDAYSPMPGSKHPDCLGQPGRQVWPEIWHIIGPMLASVLENGDATWSEKQMLPLARRGFVEECYFTFSYSPITDESGGVGGVFTAVTEVTEQVLGQRRLELLHAVSQDVPKLETMEEACARVALTLGTHPLDIPFALIYRLVEDKLILVGSHGIEPGSPRAPRECREDDCVWGVDHVPRGTLEVLDVSSWGLSEGPWPEPTSKAVMQTIELSATSRWLLITGSSPRHSFDDACRIFHTTIASHLASALTSARLHEEERARLQAFAEFDHAKTTFNNISHEFRTPLSLILLPLEEAASSTAVLAGPDFHAALRNAKRLKRLVDQLLDFARIEAKRVRVIYQSTDLAALTTDLASAFRSAVERGGVELRVHCESLGGPVLIDPDMWEKIVLNLISNAFKFTFAGVIEVTLRDRGGQVELAVRDTGVGIEEAHLPRIFDRFNRIEGVKSRSHEGSGIGLALVADLVHLLEGSITVSSKISSGTTFVVSVPRSRAEHANAIVKTAGGQKLTFADEAMQWLPAQESTGSQREDVAISPTRILLADDNADMRAYIARLLGGHWSVSEVADGIEAVASARREPPDLVISDVMMPGLDGFGVVRELRADPRLVNVPIILLSARAGDESIAAGLRSGADDYIIKPFTAAQLTMRVEAQLARARTRAAAYDERRRVYGALMNAPAPICVLTGPKLVIELANHACLEIWGKDTSITGKPLLEALPELADQQFPKLLEQVRLTGEPYRVKGMAAKLDRDREGVLRDVYMDFVYEPITDETGLVGSILVFAIDVTQQVLSQMTLEAALDDARRANRAKDEFLALLGHELRNPMSPIMTALDLMKIHSDRDVTREREIIERQAKHLVRLINDLLDVARISRGMVDLRRVRVGVAEVLARSVETALPLYEEKRHRLDVDASDELYIDADPQRIGQVFSNLLTNAAKYTPAGGQVSVRAWADSEQIVVCVKDNGIGITAEVLPHVFEMFIQDGQGRDRSSGGLGLGLAIVRALVLRHGGGVIARSGGQMSGTEIEVRLPRAQPSQATESELAFDPSISISRFTGRVLIVDDNTDAATLLCELVSAMGHDTRVAHDGPSALQTLEAFEPDIALVDIGLPVMDGYELATHLRARVRLVQIVALSGYGQSTDHEQSLRAGFVAHLVKPVDAAGLAAMLEQLMTLRAS